MKVIIAGSRDITDIKLVIKAVAQSKFEFTEVVSGCSRGVDTLAIEWAKLVGVLVARFAVTSEEWRMNPRTAGYIRNVKMADYADALVAIWDGKSKGTRHMIDIARKKGLKVHVLRTDESDKPQMPTLF